MVGITLAVLGLFAKNLVAQLVDTSWFHQWRQPGSNPPFQLLNYKKKRRECYSVWGFDQCRILWQLLGEFGIGLDDVWLI